MASIEIYLMSLLQKNPDIRTGTVSEIRERVNEEYNLNLEDEDVEAALLNIQYEGGEEEGKREYPDNFEWER